MVHIRSLPASSAMSRSSTALSRRSDTPDQMSPPLGRPPGHAAGGPASVRMRSLSESSKRMA